ncbi:MAG TPA: hypothetical protein DEV93_21755 [Chloroflexi bacterium]|nr:hypothetical protein [Chloroflexota bacterium]
MRCLRLASVQVVLSVTYAATLAAQETFGFHPLSTLSLGASFARNDLATPKRPCLTFTPAAPEGAISTEYSEVLVATQAQLDSTLNVDDKVDASFLSLFSAGGAWQQSGSIKMDASGVTLVLSARTDFGRLRTATAALTDSANALIQRKDFSTFREMCGTRYVAIERRGAAVYAVLSISDVSQATKADLGYDIHAGGGIPVIGANAEAKVRKEVENAAQEGRLSVQVLATGGGGFGDLVALVSAASAKTDAIAAIKQGLSVYMGHFTEANAVPIGFTDAPMSQFGFDPTFETPWSNARESKLSDIVARYRSVQDTLELLKQLKARLSQQALLGIDTATVGTAIAGYEDYADSLEQRHKRCKVGTGNVRQDCSMPVATQLAGARAFPSSGPAPVLSAWIRTATDTLRGDAMRRALASMGIGHAGGGPVVSAISDTSSFAFVEVRVQGRELRSVALMYGDAIIDRYSSRDQNGDFLIRLLGIKNGATHEYESDVRGMLPFAGVIVSAAVGDSVTLTDSEAWAVNGCHRVYVQLIGLPAPFQAAAQTPARPQLPLGCRPITMPGVGTLSLGGTGVFASSVFGSQGTSTAPATTPPANGPVTTGPVPSVVPPIAPDPPPNGSPAIRWIHRPARLYLSVEDAYSRRTILPLIDFVEERVTAKGLTVAVVMPRDVLF